MDNFDDNLLLTSSERSGWFKLIIPDINQVFGPIFNIAVPLIPFIYAKFSTEPVAFDTQISVPLTSLEDVVLVIAPPDRNNAIQVVSLAQIGRVANETEHSNRCYIPSIYISNIIPINPKCTVTKLLCDSTHETSIIAPDPDQTSKILKIK